MDHAKAARRALMIAKAVRPHKELVTNPRAVLFNPSPVMGNPAPPVNRFQFHNAPLYRVPRDDGGQVDPAYIPNDDPRRMENLQNFKPITDENGNHKVFYHNTDRDFSKFNTTESELGAHFGTPNQAANLQANQENPLSGRRTMSAYLNIQNPLRLEDRGNFNTTNVANQLYDMGLLNDKTYEKQIDANYRSEEAAYKDLHKAIEKAGYDGVVYLNRREGLMKKEDPAEALKQQMWLLIHANRATDDEFKQMFPDAEDSYIAFKPTQIKSATGNRGTFDPHNGDITKSDGGEVDPAYTQADLSNTLKNIKDPNISMPSNLVDQEIAARGYEEGGDVTPPPMGQRPLFISSGQDQNALSSGQQKLLNTFQNENLNSSVVSPKPGTNDWTFATPDEPGSPKPPVMQGSPQREPNYGNLAKKTSSIFKTKGFKDLIRDHLGVHYLDVTPIRGTWKNVAEPSFSITAKDKDNNIMDADTHSRLANLLGFGFIQDAAITTHHNPDLTEGAPTVLIGNGSKLRDEHKDTIEKHAAEHGVDLSYTKDGTAAKFTHFGDENELPDFIDKIESVAKKSNMPNILGVKSKGDYYDSGKYLNEIFRGTSGEEGDQNGSSRPSDIFGRIVDHVIAPYARAASSEGFRLSPDRLAEQYGLTPEEREKVRSSLFPSGKEDRSSVPLMTGQEDLDVRPTGNRGQATVDDILYASQNRAASKGQIDPEDHSDKAKQEIAKTIADEVFYHVNNSDKSAIGWYDAALKKAKQKYAEIFPEILHDRDKSMLFDAILGITSQGNDVHANSIFASRLYNAIRDGKMNLSDATKNLSGTFGNQTKAIEYNLHKFQNLLDKNGFDKMHDIFNQKMTVSDWRKKLKDDKDLYGIDGKPLTVKGSKNQMVNGWMVFGPKIGSFINNLHGDYSTLTADLWFSRTWNRILGHNFLHTPLQEAKQYRDYRDAFKAEYMNANGQKDGMPLKSVSKSGDENKKWEFGKDLEGMSPEDFDRIYNDPQELLRLAQDHYEKYAKGQFKEKSDLRRRAKNWIQNRNDPVAAPRNESERSFQQDTAELAQKLLNKKYGLNISIADIQAALWFHEKELLGKYGATTSKTAPADYADAATRAVEMHRSGNLYKNISEIQKEAKIAKAKKLPPPQSEYAKGGLVDQALRITSQFGNQLPSAVNLARSAIRRRP